MTKLNFIDLFAGASGMSEGFIKAGFEPIAHVEMNSDACYTIKTRCAYHYLVENDKQNIYIEYLKGEISRESLYKKIPPNLLETVINCEISDKSISDIFLKVKSILEKKELDLIIGGPPCQAYSLLGRYQKDIGNDPRNMLYIQYGKFLEEFKPKAFVFENVPGLLSANKGKHFVNLREYFNQIGYKVYFDTLNASDFGVLQARKRIIIIGWREDHDAGFLLFKKNKNAFTVNDILQDLPSLKPGEGFKVGKYSGEKNEYLSKFHIRNGIDFVTQHISRPHNVRDLEIYRIAINKWNLGRERLKYPDLPEHLKTHKNETAFTDRYKVIDGNGFSHTVVAHIAKDGHYYIHPDIEQGRSISVREAARLQSFPDDFYFEGSRSSAFKQIGNAVPPLMAFAIATKIKELLCQKK